MSYQEDNIEETEKNNDVSKKNYTVKNNRYMSKDLIDTPIYNEELMDNVLEGIAQNIFVEMDKQGLTVRGLGELSGVNYSHLSRLFNGQSKIGIGTLIKLAYALHISPGELFPYDVNRRKTNGQRFDEITKEMDIASSNFLIGFCADYAREWRRMKLLVKK